MMKPLSQASDAENRKKVLYAKRKYGLIYGAFAALVFALAAWGLDGYQLSQAHAFHPWLKLATGLALCIPAGGLVGWIAARVEKATVAVILWLAASAFFARLTIALPFQILPALISRLEPDLGGLLHYVLYQEFQARFGVAFAWMVVFGFFVGLLQLPMSDSAVFSGSTFGKSIPLVVCAVLMIIAGYTVDTLNNAPLRDALVAVNSSIQFFVDHEGQPVDPQTSRQMHLASIRDLQDLVDRPRQLIVSHYDKLLGQFDVLVKFGDTLVECTTVYEQLSFCKRISSPAP